MFERVLARFVSLRFDGSGPTTALVLMAVIGTVAVAASPSVALAAQRSDAPVTDPQFVRASNAARETREAALRKRASIEAMQARVTRSAPTAR